MVTWDVFLMGVALLLSSVIYQGGPVKKFSMGCECGIRKVDLEIEKECFQSAKLESTQPQETSIIKRQNYV